jgi:hypothetical protein
MKSNPTKKHSPAYGAYSITRLHIASFFMMVYATPLTMQALFQARQNGDLCQKLIDDLQESFRIWGKFTDDMTPDDFRILCNEMFLCRKIQSMDIYLTEVLLMIFLKRPETLKSSETVKVADVIAWGDSKAIVRKIAERKIDNLGYRSFDDMLKYLRDDLGVPASLDESDIAIVREAIEVRNIVVHNSRRINAIFIRRSGRSDLIEGKSFPITLDYVMDAGRAINRIVQSLDSAFIDHFSLPSLEEFELANFEI